MNECICMHIRTVRCVYYFFFMFLSQEKKFTQVQTGKFSNSLTFLPFQVPVAIFFFASRQLCAETKENVYREHEATHSNRILDWRKFSFW